MRIKIINPNTSREMTRAIDAAARKYKHSDTEIVTVSSSFGPTTIDNFYDEVLSSVGVVQEVKKGLAEAFDGFVIACFNDPGLQASREVSYVPVVGIAEAAMLIACTLAYRFSVLSMPRRSFAAMKELLKRYGLEHRCASIRLIDVPVLEMENNPQEMKKALISEARHAIDEDGAEAILLGCAGLSGVDKEFESQLGVPVIDGVVAAVKILELLHDYGLKTSKSLTYRSPEKKAILGCPGLMRATN
jgi:allantoin racemase